VLAVLRFIAILKNYFWSILGGRELNLGSIVTFKAEANRL
jgi:hypothetical protein